MKLWTVQPVKVYESILENGYFICDEKYIGEYWKERYNWLVEKMKEKIGTPPKKIKYPIWAWYKYNGKNHKPDLRVSALGNRGDKMVCIELDIPDNEVVLSDFDAWHSVLNDWYYNVNCISEEIWDNDHEWLDSLTPEEKQKAIEKSWNDIFDISEYESDWCRRGKWVQATFWVLKKEYIKKVQYFTAR